MWAIDGNHVQLWWDGNDDAPDLTSSRAHLIPSYDEYTVGFRDRSAIERRLAKAGVQAGKAGSEALIANLLTIDGQAVGSWRRTVKRGEVLVEARPLVRLTRAELRAIEAQAARFGAFLELPARLESAA